MKFNFLILIFFMSHQHALSMDYIDVITNGVKAGTSIVGQVYETFRNIAEISRDNSARDAIQRAIGGGHSIYLQEDRQVRKAIVPYIVPFSIDVTRAEIRSESGKIETANATRLAKKFFNGEPAEKERVRRKKFMIDEFGYTRDPAPGERKILEIWYRCLDDRGSPVGEPEPALAHEMEIIRLSCMRIPSIYKGKFGQ